MQVKIQRNTSCKFRKSKLDWLDRSGEFFDQSEVADQQKLANNVNYEETMLLP